MIELNRDQLTAIALLASGMPVTKTAKALGVTTHCLSAWRRNNEQYRNALNHAIGEVEAGVRGRVPSLVDAAMSALVSMIENPDLSPDVRMRAIEMVFNRAGHASAEIPKAGALPSVAGAAKIVYYLEKPSSIIDAQGETVIQEVESAITPTEVKE